MSAQLQVNDVSVRFGEKLAVDKVQLTLKEGQIGCLLGPSGCGKTTLLRTIAGFQLPTEGEIVLHKTVVSQPGWALAPEKRRIGMVFQDIALFPHLTVDGNIAFGLRDLPRSEQKVRVARLLKLIGLEGVGGRYPHQLSGGQQQRIALARALAPQPDILLFDEPFSSLDVELREQLARDVRHILKELGITAVVVTHDQMEAFAMADEIGLMREGRMHQWASAYDLYHEPVDRFVADFVGQGRMLPGRLASEQMIEFELGRIHAQPVEALPVGAEVEVLVRPDDVLLDRESPLKGKVKERLFRGAEFLYTLELPSGDELLCLAPSHQDCPVGQTVGIRLDIEHVRVFPR